MSRRDDALMMTRALAGKCCMLESDISISAVHISDIDGGASMLSADSMRFMDSIPFGTLRERPALDVGDIALVLAVSDPIGPREDHRFLLLRSDGSTVITLTLGVDDIIASLAPMM